jgi:hypothetical protein
MLGSKSPNDIDMLPRGAYADMAHYFQRCPLTSDLWGQPLHQTGDHGSRVPF